MSLSGPKALLLVQLLMALTTGDVETTLLSPFICSRYPLTISLSRAMTCASQLGCGNLFIETVG